MIGCYIHGTLLDASPSPWPNAWFVPIKNKPLGIKMKFTGPLTPVCIPSPTSKHHEIVFKGHAKIFDTCGSVKIAITPANKNVLITIDLLDRILIISLLDAEMMLDGNFVDIIHTASDGTKTVVWTYDGLASNINVGIALNTCHFGEPALVYHMMTTLNNDEFSIYFVTKKTRTIVDDPFRGHIEGGSVRLR